MKLLLENWREYERQEEQYLLLEEFLLNEYWGEKAINWAWEKFKEIGDKGKRAAAQEWAETKEVAPILGRLLTGKEVTDEEKKKLSAQALDVLKTAGLVAIASPPMTLGPLILMVITLQKLGVNVLPSAWREIT